MNIVSLDQDNFDMEVLQNREPVVIDVWGESCVPCKALKPYYEQLAENMGTNNVRWAEVNTSKQRRLALRMRVIGLPCFLIYSDGNEVARIQEGVTPANLESLIKQALASLNNLDS